MQTDIAEYKCINNKLTVAAWFSGTGGTEMAAKEYVSQLLARGEQACDWPIEKCTEPDESYQALCANGVDRLVIFFPVYAFGAPQIVIDWCHNLPFTVDKCAVVSVSGGGEMWPNTVCRVEVIQLIEAKGITVDYERMLVMPINLTFPKSVSLDQHLIQILPKKVAHMIDEMNAGVVRRQRQPLTSPLLFVITKHERSACRKASKYFQITDACIFCGKCQAYCPTKNIDMPINSKPIYKDQCLMCLRCVYSCPANAITAPSFQKWLLKEGFDMTKIVHEAEFEPIESAKEASKGILYMGVKRYLLDLAF